MAWRCGLEACRGDTWALTHTRFLCCIPQMPVHLDGAWDRAGREGKTYSGLLRWLGTAGCLLVDHLRL